MLLSFESLDELESIIAAMGYTKVVPTLTVDGLKLLPEHPFVDPDWIKHAQEPDPDSGDDVGNESAPTGQPESTSIAIAPTSLNEQPAEAPRRKRRTKAEMEAARAADQAPGDGSDMTSADAATQSQPVTQTANPFEANAASPTTQAILNAPNQQAATLAGIAAMQAQSPFDAQTAEANTAVTPVSESAPADAGTFIEQRALEILSTQTEPLTAVKHMHFCRDFIAKHKQEKYLQGFALAGLPSAIGAYKAEQCARHQAALEFLELN